LFCHSIPKFVFLCKSLSLDSQNSFINLAGMASKVVAINIIIIIIIIIRFMFSLDESQPNDRQITAQVMRSTVLMSGHA